MPSNSVRTKGEGSKDRPKSVQRNGGATHSCPLPLPISRKSRRPVSGQQPLSIRGQLLALGLLPNDSSVRAGYARTPGKRKRVQGTRSASSVDVGRREKRTHNDAVIATNTTTLDTKRQIWGKPISFNVKRSFPSRPDDKPKPKKEDVLMSEPLNSLDLTSPARSTRRLGTAPLKSEAKASGMQSSSSRRTRASPKRICSQASPMSQVSVHKLNSESCPSFFGPMSVAERKYIRTLSSQLGDEEVFAEVDTVAGTGMITIRGKHVKRLTNFKMLEDEVVNGVVNIANNYFMSVETTVFFHSSWFFFKLVGGNGVHGDGNKFQYEEVARFKKPYRLSHVQLMLFPINVGNYHWCLGVLDFGNRSILYIDSLNDRPGRLGQSNFSTNIMRWLRRAAEDEMGKERAEETIGFDKWKSFVVGSDYPQQSDSTSCGVFMLSTAVSLAAGKIPTYRQRDMVDLRHRLAKNLRENCLSDV